MNVWIVTNGWQGNGAVACILTALDDVAEDEVKEMAQDAFVKADPKYSVGELVAEKITVPYICEIS